MQIWNVSWKINRNDLSIPVAILIVASNEAARNEACVPGKLTLPDEVAPRLNLLKPRAKRPQRIEFARQERCVPRKVRHHRLDERTLIRLGRTTFRQRDVGQLGTIHGRLQAGSGKCATKKGIDPPAATDDWPVSRLRNTRRASQFRLGALEPQSHLWKKLPLLIAGSSLLAFAPTANAAVTIGDVTTVTTKCRSVHGRSPLRTCCIAAGPMPAPHGAAGNRPRLATSRRCRVRYRPTPGW